MRSGATATAATVCVVVVLELQQALHPRGQLVLLPHRQQPLGVLHLGTAGRQGRGSRCVLQPLGVPHMSRWEGG